MNIENILMEKPSSAGNILSIKNHQQSSSSMLCSLSKRQQIASQSPFVFNRKNKCLFVQSKQKTTLSLNAPMQQQQNRWTLINSQWFWFWYAQYKMMNIVFNAIFNLNIIIGQNNDRHSMNKPLILSKNIVQNAKELSSNKSTKHLPTTNAKTNHSTGNELNIRSLNLMFKLLFILFFMISTAFANPNPSERNIYPSATTNTKQQLNSNDRFTITNNNNNENYEKFIKNDPHHQLESSASALKSLSSLPLSSLTLSANEHHRSNFYPHQFEQMFGTNKFTNNNNFNNNNNNNNNDDTIMKYKMLNQLRMNHEMHRRANHKLRLNDPIFDPSFEELSLDSSEARTMPRATMMNIMVRQLNNKHYHHNNQPSAAMIIANDDPKQQEFNRKNIIINSFKTGKFADIDQTDNGDNNNSDNLSLEDQQQTVKKIITSGWIQHTSTNKLLHYLKKIDEVLYKDTDADLDLIYSFNDDPSSLEDTELLVNANINNNDNNNAKLDKSKRTGAMIQDNKNLEVILNRIMSTPTVVKKRGEGPQLSIDYPLAVLRQRLIAELTRRRARETEEQIAINTAILKKLGRRRRSIVESSLSLTNVVKQPNKSLANNLIIDCDEIRCNIDDLNWKRSNIRPSIINKNIDPEDKLKSNEQGLSKLKTNSALFKIVRYPQKIRFRNNDKYFMFDRAESVQPQRADSNNIFPMSNNGQAIARINSKKPTKNLLENNSWNTNNQNKNNDDNVEWYFGRKTWRKTSTSFDH